jgi:hypothetical protein
MAVEEQLHTFAALKAWIDGPSAEAAFESSVKRILGNLAGGINKILLASRESCQSLLPLERRIAVDTIPFVYVLIIGKDGAREGARLVVDLRRASLLAEDLVGDRASRFRSIANGSEIVDDVDRLLGEARSSLLDGELEFSFLQCVIAAEMATTRFVRNECIRRGISKKKLDDLKREMTYSWALNVGLHLCMDPPQAIDAGLVSRMNQARSVRNELMHEASFEMTAGDVRQLVEDTKQYLEVLRRFARRSVEAT